MVKGYGQLIRKIARDEWEGIGFRWRGDDESASELMRNNERQIDVLDWCPGSRDWQVVQPCKELRAAETD